MTISSPPSDAQDPSSDVVIVRTLDQEEYVVGIAVAIYGVIILRTVNSVAHLGLLRLPTGPPLY